MKDFLRAYKLYFKASFSPILTICGLFFFTFICILLFIEPIDNTHEDYAGMLSTIGIGHVLSTMTLMIGYSNTRTTKFFFSVSVSKKLYTIAITFAALSLCLIYDIIMCIIGSFVFESSVIADMLILNSFYTIMICFFYSTSGLPKLNIFSLLFYVLVLSPLIFKDNLLEGGFSFELPQAALISAVILVVGISLNILIMNLWWKKSGRNFKTIPQNNAFVFGNK